MGDKGKSESQVTPVLSDDAADKNRKDYQTELRKKVKQGRDNPAFTRIIEGALNGRTNKAVGW